MAKEAIAYEAEAELASGVDVAEVIDPFMLDHINTAEAAAYLVSIKCPVPAKTLTNWRSKSIGPAYWKLAGGVTYQRIDLLNWSKKAMVRVDPSLVVKPGDLL